MELSHVIAAEKVLRDSTSQKYTLVDLFNIFYIPQTANPARFFALHGRILSVDEGSVVIKITIQHEDGTAVDEALLAGEVKKGDLDFVAYFGPTIIDKTGKYYLRTEVNGAVLPDHDRFYITAVPQT